MLIHLPVSVSWKVHFPDAHGWHAKTIALVARSTESSRAKMRQLVSDLCQNEMYWSQSPLGQGGFLSRLEMQSGEKITATCFVPFKTLMYELLCCNSHYNH